MILARQEANAAARLGITASRKIGGAVVRNRAKRLVREAFRSTLDLWPAGVDLVVIVRKPLGDARLAEIVGEWRSSAGLVKKRAALLLAQPLAASKNSRV